MNTPRLSVLTLLLPLLLISACGAPKKVEKPLDTMMNRSVSISDRMDAAAQAEEDPQLYESELHIKNLKLLVISRSHPDELRFYALDTLVKMDREATLDWLTKQIHQIQGFNVLEAAARLGINDQRKDLNPGLARRMRVMFRDVPDAERIEMALIEELNDGKPALEIMKQVIEGEYGAEIVARSDTWEALTRLETTENLQTFVTDSTVKKNPLHDIRDSWNTFGILPLTRMDLLRIQLLRLDIETGPWAQSQRILSRVNEEKKKNLALRDIPVLLYLYQYRKSLLNDSREELIRQISLLLNNDLVFERTGGFKRDQIHTQSERFDDHVDQLSDMDLMTLRVILDTLQSPRVRTQLFSQAEVDMADLESEHGGLMTWNDKGLITVTAYPPKEVAHDNAYVSPKKLIVDAFEGLAHYHFHAQKERNMAIAGPGDGDMEFAENTGLNCIVLTTIDKTRINVDYFNERGVVIDLGIITKP